jgi:hypothetical protein
VYGVKRASGNGRTTLSRRAPFRGLGDCTVGSVDPLTGDTIATCPDVSSLPISSLPIANQAGAIPTASSLTLASGANLNLTTLAYWGLAAAGAVLVIGAFSGGRR